jgi:8-oxo-dGTP diphosphatase
MPTGPAKTLAPDAPLTLTDAVAAVIRHEDGRYLLQLRDDIPTIPFPGFWGFFGGSVEPGETDEAALRRELIEELQLRPRTLSYATNIEVDLEPSGYRKIYRAYFESPLNDSEYADLVLGEGADMGLFTKHEILTAMPVTPYDAYALWLLANPGLFRVA